MLMGGGVKSLFQSKLGVYASLKFNGNCISPLVWRDYPPFFSVAAAVAVVPFFYMQATPETLSGEVQIFHRSRENFSQVRNFRATGEPKFFHLWKIYGSPVKNSRLTREENPACPLPPHGSMDSINHKRFVRKIIHFKKGGIL
ncbi:MAG: hypothetical protein LBT83_03060 [Tannerella sp.]|jgi:hypothetical protein|nr:hypothetical protein [Tannerella sp.]